MCIWDRWRVTVDNNGLQARALSWLFKKTQKTLHKKGTKFCRVFFFIFACLNRFLQWAVTALPACMRISAVTEQHPSLREIAGSFSTWFSLCISLPFQTPISQALFTPFSSFSSLAYASQHAHLQRHYIAENKCLSWSWKETVYGLCCILNLLTHSCVLLESDVVSSCSIYLILSLPAHICSTHSTSPFRQRYIYQFSDKCKKEGKSKQTEMIRAGIFQSP